VTDQQPPIDFPARFRRTATILVYASLYASPDGGPLRRILPAVVVAMREVADELAKDGSG
jgi:hypothetical protein